MDSATGVATMKLNRPPVNSLNLDLLTDISIAIEKLENDKCKGVIITSSNNKVFSAGLDILEMYQPQLDRLRVFWHTLQEVWIRLYNSSLVTIAAVNGHSPAGGCLLAMSCDYRLMAPNFTMGLNETQLGIVPPPWFVDTMLNVIGPRQTERCCTLGMMMNSQQAKDIGLVDDIVPLESLMERANAEMQAYLKLPAMARQLTKQQIREPVVDKLLTKREEDIAHFVNFITKESVQKTLGFYLEQLKKKSTKQQN